MPCRFSPVCRSLQSYGTATVGLFSVEVNVPNACVEVPRITATRAAVRSEVLHGSGFPQVIVRLG